MEHMTASPTGIRTRVSISAAQQIEIALEGLPASAERLAIFVALGSGGEESGSCIVPFGQQTYGSTVYLPFRADQLLRFELQGSNLKTWRQSRTSYRWGNVTPTAVSVCRTPGAATIQLSAAELGDPPSTSVAVYIKDMATNDGWGELIGCSDPTVPNGIGDRYIPTYLEVTFAPRPHLAKQHRLSGGKAVVYQLFVRLFGNTKTTCKLNGSLAENGCGKFADIDEAAIRAIREMGATHIWLTGVLRQATGTDYSRAGLPADDPDLLKGIAGSPYAIKDYFDVCPDYAVDPANRLTEFKALIRRIHDVGLKALIDFVPNHVARSYHSRIHPELDFGTRGQHGKGDLTTGFFHPDNNFFYLRPDFNGPPLVLPTFRNGKPLTETCKVLGGCDGRFQPEAKIGRVTGNNAVTWWPRVSDWYETVKLNYGFDFTTGKREFPNALQPEKRIPDTWSKMDQILAYWQEMGVDGFRCDMAHMVPPEFWEWAIARTRQRDASVFFLAEAYDNDAARVPSGDSALNALENGRGNVMVNLLNAGFNAVYDDPSYKVLKRIYDGPAWANDLDQSCRSPFLFANSLRYAENHDEVRLASKGNWGGIGMEIGRPVSALLYALSTGPAMLYNGQEVGEAAAGAPGFSGDDGRTTIFDYWQMPEFAKFVNEHRYDGGQLSLEQKALREFYTRLLMLMREPAFQRGAFFPLNPLNQQSENFGRLPDETASGHWMYAFLRSDLESEQAYLVVVNLHPTQAFQNVQVQLPAFNHTDSAEDSTRFQFRECLSSSPALEIGVSDSQVRIPSIPPLTPYFLEITG
jgi:glycosidase